jgi:exopolyphosphatase/guanosine-5'-triphosphate,3'-diphosphate pyrophosphatase
MPRFASIDIGSNTLLLLIAEQDAEGVRAVRDECRFGRLAQGIAESRRLHPDAIARSLDILRDFKAIIDEAGATQTRAVATQAVREAENAAEFLEPANQILEIDIEVIEGEREAQLVATAVAESFPDLCEDALVTADVGGASTEVILSRGGTIEWVKSIPIGAVKLSETFLRSDPPGPEETRALVAEIDSHLAQLALPDGVPLVGTAGTATSIASIELKLIDYDAERVHGLKLSRATVARTLARILELTVEQKRHLRGLEPQRADVIAGGLAIYSRLLERMNAACFVVSDRGVRWGVAYEMAREA